MHVLSMLYTPLSHCLEHENSEELLSWHNMFILSRSSLYLLSPYVDSQALSCEIQCIEER